MITVTVLVSFVFFVTRRTPAPWSSPPSPAHGGSADDDGPKWLRVFWGSVTALVTGGLLFAGSIDALKSAVVLTSLPFSLILLLMMWGLHKAFLHGVAAPAGAEPLPGAADERQRQALRAAGSDACRRPCTPSRDEVYRFMNDVVAPGDQRGFRRCSAKGLAVDAQLDPGNASLSLEIGHGEQHRFFYQVLMRGYFTPCPSRVPRAACT